MKKSKMTAVLSIAVLVAFAGFASVAAAKETTIFGQDYESYNVGDTCGTSTYLPATVQTLNNNKFYQVTTVSGHESGETIIKDGLSLADDIVIVDAKLAHGPKSNYCFNLKADQGTIAELVCSKCTTGTDAGGHFTNSGYSSSSINSYFIRTKSSTSVNNVYNVGTVYGLGNSWHTDASNNNWVNIKFVIHFAAKKFDVYMATGANNITADMIANKTGLLGYYESLDFHDSTATKLTALATYSNWNGTGYTTMCDNIAVIQAANEVTTTAADYVTGDDASTAAYFYATVNAEGTSYDTIKVSVNGADRPKKSGTVVSGGSVTYGIIVTDVVQGDDIKVTAE